ncbi:MAG: hypothetical protein ACOC8X_07090 [Chloroflexota bacterium]
MSYEMKLKELKAQEQAVAKTRAQDDDPPGVDFDRWLEVAFKLSVVILAGGALGSTVRDIWLSWPDVMARLIDVVR